MMMRDGFEIRLLSFALDCCWRVLAWIFDPKWFDRRSIVHRAIQIENEVPTMPESSLKRERLTCDRVWIISFRNQWPLIRLHRCLCPYQKEYLLTRLSYIAVSKKRREKCVSLRRDKVQRTLYRFFFLSFSIVFWWQQMDWSETSNGCSPWNAVCQLLRWLSYFCAWSSLICEGFRCSPIEFDLTPPSNTSKTTIQLRRIVIHGTVSIVFSCKWWCSREPVEDCFVF